MSHELMIRAAIAEHFQLNIEEVHPDMQLTDLGDSLELATIANTLEDTYTSLKIDNRELQKARTVDDLIKCVETGLTAK